VFIVILLYAIIHIPYIQSKITKYVATELAEATDLKVSIESVDISLWNKLILENVTVTTKNDSIILQSLELGAYIQHISFSKKEITLQNIELVQANLHFEKNKKGIWNIQKFLEKVKTKDPNKPTWIVNIEAFELINSKLSYKDNQSYSFLKFGINTSDIDLEKVNLKVSSFTKSKNDFTGKILKLSCVDKSGFTLNNFATTANVNDSIIELINTQLYTPSSKIHLKKLDIDYSNCPNIKSFKENANYYCDFNYSKIHIKDLAYFSPNLENAPYEFSLSGIIKGKISNFKGKKINIGYGLSSRYVGDFEVTGLPILEETFLYINAKDLHTSSADINNFRLPPFSENKYIKAPQIISDIRDFDYTGNLTGFVNDFVAYGVLTTPIGVIDSDISFKETSKNADFIYSGNLSFLNFDLNKISNDKNIWGKTTFTTKITGEIKDKNFQKAVVQGDITKINILDYTYKNIRIDGLIAKQKFDGELIIQDTNINMSFKGLFDNSSEIPEFKFNTTIENANLFALKLQPDSVSIVSLTSEVDFIGLTLDNLKGKVKIPEIQYTNKNGTYLSHGILIDIDNIGDSRNISLVSDLIDITINGKGIYNELPTYVYDYIHGHIPSLPQYFEPSSKTLSPQFNASVKIKKIDSLLHVIYPNIRIAENSYLNAVFSNDAQLLVLNSEIPELTINNQKIENIKIHTEGTPLDINTNLLYDLPLNKRTFQNISNNIEINKDSIQLSCFWEHQDSATYSGNVKAKGSFLKSNHSKIPAVFLSFSPSTIINGDSVWSISKTDLQIDSTSLFVKNSSIKHKKQSIQISGKISENPDDIISAEFENYNINNLNNLINSKYVSLEGELIGKLNLQDYYNQQLIFADITVPQFEFNNHEMGKMSISSNWIYEQKAIAMKISLLKGNLETIHAEGFYVPSTKEIDYNIELQYVRLADFEEIFASTLDNFTGYADAKLKATGYLNSPILEGNLQLMRTKFKVNYTQTPYNTKGTLTAQGSKLIFDNLQITDTLSNTGIASGYFDIKDIKNPNYKINISTNKILALNTKIKDNDLFYGTAFYIGNAIIEGDLNHTKFTANGSTAENTKFNIPLSYSELSEDHDFLFFAQKDTIKQIIQNEFSPIERDESTEVNINLNVNSNALCQIIFDERVGDIIKVRGDADLQMMMNKNGDFTMFGEYDIENGDYLFTLRNLINKKFIIQKGGRISWTGDPLDAQLDVSADYKIKASPKPLLKEFMDSTNNQKIPITCRVHLKNNLMSPDISYEIIAPDNSGQVKIKDVIANFDEDRKNINFLSLLILNSFTDSKDNYNAGGSVNTSIEVVTSQINQLLSQIDDDIDVGVGVKTGDQTKASEFEFAVSTQMLNNRILVNLNGTTEFGQAASSSTNTQTNDFAGNISVEVKVNEDGTFRVKGFSRSNTDPLNENQGNTQGIGLFFTREFNYVKDFFKKREN